MKVLEVIGRFCLRGVVLGSVCGAAYLVLLGMEAEFVALTTSLFSGISAVSGDAMAGALLGVPVGLVLGMINGVLVGIAVWRRLKRRASLQPIMYAVAWGNAIVLFPLVCTVVLAIPALLAWWGIVSTTRCVIDNKSRPTAHQPTLL